MDPTWGKEGSWAPSGRFSDDSGDGTESGASNKDLAFITTDGLPRTGLGDDSRLIFMPSESQLFWERSDGRSKIPESDTGVNTGNTSAFFVTDSVALLLLLNESSGTWSDSGTFEIWSFERFPSARLLGTA